MSPRGRWTQTGGDPDLPCPLARMEHEFNWVYCPECNTTLVVEARLQDGCERYEQLVCPWCGRELGEVRADLGCDFIGIACGYVQPGSPCYGADLQ